MKGIVVMDAVITVAVKYGQGKKPRSVSRTRASRRSERLFI